VQAVARLTADNLVFMAKLRAAESAAAAASAERDELVLALEEHKGPWMDEVRHDLIVGSWACMWVWYLLVAVHTSMLLRRALGQRSPCLTPVN
jgi:hypothetical protein